MKTPATPKQLNEEEHYYDRLAQLQMSDSLYEKKNNGPTLSNGETIEAVHGTENNETWLNEMFGIT